MVKLIKDEEEREIERQEMLSNVVNTVERKRLEKIFEIEREKVREQQKILENKFQEDIDKVSGIYEAIE